MSPLVALGAPKGGLVRETAPANGQRSQWVGKSTRGKTVGSQDMSINGSLKQLSHAPSSRGEARGIAVDLREGQTYRAGRGSGLPPTTGKLHWCVDVGVCRRLASVGVHSERKGSQLGCAGYRPKGSNGSIESTRCSCLAEIPDEQRRGDSRPARGYPGARCSRG